MAHLLREPAGQLGTKATAARARAEEGAVAPQDGETRQARLETHQLLQRAEAISADGIPAAASSEANRKGRQSDRCRDRRCKGSSLGADLFQISRSNIQAY